MRDEDRDRVCDALIRIIGQLRSGEAIGVIVLACVPPGGTVLVGGGRFEANGAREALQHAIDQLGGNAAEKPRVLQ